MNLYGTKITIEDIETFFNASKIVSQALVNIAIYKEEDKVLSCRCCGSFARRNYIKHTDDCAYLIAKQLIS